MREVDVQRFSDQPNMISLIFTYVSVISFGIVCELLYTELGNGARLTGRSCHGDLLTAHGRKKMGW
jgi:hypothetical protein